MVSKTRVLFVLAFPPKDTVHQTAHSFVTQKEVGTDTWHNGPFSFYLELSCCPFSKKTLSCMFCGIEDAQALEHVDMSFSLNSEL